MRQATRSVTTTTTPQREQTPSLPSYKKRYLNDREVEAIFGISRRQLQRMRLLNQGPQFRRFSHKVVMYEVTALERWIESLPLGGSEENSS
jgi:hypothetical protein